MNLEELNFAINHCYGCLLKLEKELKEVEDKIEENKDELVTYDVDQNRMAIMMITDKKININKVKQEIERLKRIRFNKFQLP